MPQKHEDVSHSVTSLHGDLKNHGHHGRVESFAFMFTDGESSEAAEVVCRDDRVRSSHQFPPARERTGFAEVRSKVSGTLVWIKPGVHREVVSADRWTDSSKRTWSWYEGWRIRKKLWVTAKASWNNARQSVRLWTGSWRRLCQTWGSRYAWEERHPPCCSSC